MSPEFLSQLVAPAIAVIVGFVLERILHGQNQKIAEIHVLVNNRLDEALRSNEELQGVVREYMHLTPPEHLTPEAAAIVTTLLEHEVPT